MANIITIGTTDQLPDGERIVTAVNDMYIAIFNVNGRYYAIEDICTHDDGPLAEGDVVGEGEDVAVECPRHGAQFKLKTGKPTFPAVFPVARFQVEVDGDQLKIDVDNPITG